MSRTKLQHHKQDGKKLLPPFAQVEVTNSSWLNERLPEMLWAVILVGNLPRERALNIFRRVVNAVLAVKNEETKGDVRLNGIATMSTQEKSSVLEAIIADEDARECLSSLLLFEGLPGKESWTVALGRPASDRSVDYLMRGVASTLWHQSQEATDCRWVRLLSIMAAGKLLMPDSFGDSARELVNYPNEGDMKKVRPFIRSTEILLNSMEADLNPDVWPNKFWSECLANTPCFSLLREPAANAPVSGTTIQRIGEVYEHLIKHWLKTRCESGIDAKHDTTFGLAFYSLNILRELLSVGNSNAILGRFGLRSLLDGFVTLSYLIYKDNSDLWRSHRVFGAGQAKLSSLKLEELKSEKCYADVPTLTEIANEDAWEEYLPINVGHWEDSNLRREAVESGVKAEYDKFYTWTSSFIHGHWGSVRESVFDTCGNPVHRLHRIPRRECKILPDVVPDACELMDKTLDLVSRVYPIFPHRVKV
jgi:hypothetical protein